MHNTSFSVRNLATVALLVSSAAVALAGPPVTGKVTGVDQNSHTFKVEWVHKFTDRHNMAKENTHETTFKTSDKTAYIVGSNKGGWADLKKGAHVTVSANAGVADKVEIVSGP
jgi:nicotinamide riboside kinase